MSGVFWRIEELLGYVRAPSQYIGGEHNSIVKPDAEVRFALCFPDTYAIGMSHLGLQILYCVLNSVEWIACERCFAPEADMEELLRGRAVPLFTLETHRPLRECDIVGFSLQYELCYTNVLNILELAGIPAKASERGNSDPLIVGGGATVFNPEPLADFFDLFIIGDGEETVLRLCELYRECRAEKRETLIETLGREIPGAYAPSLYEARYDEEGNFEGIEAKVELPPLRRAVVEELDSAPYPTAPVVPFSEIVHERIAIEVSRGCPHLCKFCQAGAVRRPLRHRSPQRILEIAEESYRRTGYDEIALCALSVTDYPGLLELVGTLTERFTERRVSVSLASLRVDSRLLDVGPMLSAVRKSGLTLAPEAGTERLRELIGKRVTDEDLFNAAEEAYRHGWRLLKLYFMIGIPGESDRDIEAIAELALKVAELRRKYARSSASLNITISNFIPKPHTPLQWEGMAERDYLRERQRQIKKLNRSPRIHYKFSAVAVSFIEAVLSRGDRRLGEVILRAQGKGCKLDAWSEHFKFELWEEAFEETGIDPSFYANRSLPLDRPLSWSHIPSPHSSELLLRLRVK